MKSTVSLHFEKHKNGGGLQRHNERKPGQKHSNDNIDDERTKDNIFLKTSNKSYDARINDIIEKGYIGKRKIQKNAVRMVTATVQIGGDLAQYPLYADDEKTQKAIDAREKEQIEFLKTAYEILKEYYGEQNIISATIHVDETTPHLHFDFVPITNDGRLSATDVIGNRYALKKRHAQFLADIQEVHPEFGFERDDPDKVKGLEQDVFEKLTRKARIVENKSESKRAFADRKGKKAAKQILEAKQEQKHSLRLLEQIQLEKDELKREQERTETLIDSYELTKETQDEREERLHQKENELSKKENELRGRDASMKSREIVLNAKERKLKAKENELDSKETTLDIRIIQLNDAIQAHQSAFKTERSQIDLDKQKNAQRASELDLRASELNVREKDLNTLSDALRRSQSDLERERGELNEKRDKLREWADKLKKQHAYLKRLKNELNKFGNRIKAWASDEFDEIVQRVEAIPTEENKRDAIEALREVVDAAELSANEMIVESTADEQSDGLIL